MRKAQKITSPQKSPRLKQLASMVDRALGRILPGTNKSPRIIHEAMRYCVFSGGKRFRPLLCLGACEAAGKSAQKALLVACAIELIHTYSLVHDDLPSMDNASLRRGKPSCHCAFGEGNAVLVGDALLTLAFDCLSRNGTLNSLGIIRTFGQACGTAGLIGGQVLDLQAMNKPSSTKEALEDIARRKTAALISASVISGAMAAGAGTKQLESLSRFGQNIGLAFQLIDDVHDRDGLAHVLGLACAKSRARWLIADAYMALRPFGNRADVLRQLASWLSGTA